MYHLDQFPMGSLVVLSRLTLLCLHHQRPPPELFSSCTMENLYPINTNAADPIPLVWLLGTRILLAAFVNLGLCLSVTFTWLMAG